MKILAKKAYEFCLYDKGAKVKAVSVRPMVFTDVPDWAAKDPMFDAALKAGNIEILGKAGNVSVSSVDALLAQAKGLGIQHPGSMTIEKLRTAVAEAEAREETQPAAGAAKAAAKPPSRGKAAAKANEPPAPVEPPAPDLPGQEVLEEGIAGAV